MDSELQFAGVPRQRVPTIGYTPAASTVIIELKFGPESAPEADRVTNDLPFRLARFSKYVTGMERI